MRPNPSNLTQTTHTTKCIRSRFGPTKQQIQNSTHKKEVLFPSSLISTNITVRCLRLCANLSMMRTNRIKKKKINKTAQHTRQASFSYKSNDDASCIAVPSHTKIPFFALRFLCIHKRGSHSTVCVRSVRCTTRID